MIWKSYKVDDALRITDIFSFFIRRCNGGYIFQGEAHNFWECVYVNSGEICVSADERVYNLKEGEMIFHKPMEFHNFHIKDDKNAEIIVFAFSMEGKSSKYYRNKVFDLTPDQKNMIYKIIDKAESFYKTDNIEKKCDYIDYCNLFCKSGIFTQTFVCYTILLLLSLTENENVDIISDSQDAIIFRNAVDYMNSNVYDKISISQLSDICNVSDSTIKRIFQRYAGVGVHKYFLNLKIKVATNLLNYGFSVSEVSEKLGFNSQAYFSSAFKRETGKSPSEFK